MSANGSKNGLTRSQKRAVSAMLTSRTIAEAALSSGVSERSIYRWLGDPGFRAALGSAEGLAVDNAARRLGQLADLALDTFEAVLSDPGASHTVAVRAADLVLAHWLKVRELSQIEMRLSALEKVVYDNNKKPAGSSRRANGKF